MCASSTISQVRDVSEASAGRRAEEARDGLADPELREAERVVDELGADSLDHLDLTGAQTREVLDDLAGRVDAITTSRRYSA